MDQIKLNLLRIQDRVELETLLISLNGAKNAIKRDECGDWIIAGSRGTIRACDGKFYVYISSGSARAWTFVKKLLVNFTIIHQDGDEEGVLMLSRMLDTDEAEVLRSYICFLQATDTTEKHLQSFNERVRKAG